MMFREVGAALAGLVLCCGSAVADPQDPAAAGAAASQPARQEPASAPVAGATDEPRAKDAAAPQVKAAGAEGGSDAKPPWLVPPDLSIKLTPWLKITPGALTQLRYTVNARTQYPDDEEATTIGFIIPRTRVWLTADLTDFVSLYIRAGVNSDGNFAVEHAYGDIKLGDFSIRAGQFGVPVFGEADNVLPNMTLGADFSLLMMTFDPGAAQGAWLNYNPERLRVRLAVTNGLRTGFSDFGNQPKAADIALTGFFEGMVLGTDWSRVDDFTSFRGSDMLLKVGAGVHYQSGGATSGTNDLSALYISGDVRVEGDGWNFTSEAVWTRIALGDTLAAGAAQDVYEDVGLMVQGGFFVLDWLEPYVRYDHIIPDDTPRPEDQRGPADEPLRALTGGVNAYIVPHAHTATAALEFQYLFDGVNRSLVPVTPPQGILASDEAQWLIRAQITFAL